MNDLIETFVSLLKYGGMAGAPAPDCSEFGRWDEILRMAVFHNVLPIIYTAMAEEVVGCNYGAEELQSLKKAVALACVQQGYANHKLSKLLQSLYANGVEAVLFKGATLAALYKVPLTRISCDADLLVRRSDYQKTVEELNAMGFALVKKESQEEVKAFVSEDLTIDLHMRLWGDISGRHVWFIEALDIAAYEKAISFDINGIEVKTLGYQEHFLYLLVHMAKHFIIKGAGLRHLLDISLYFNAHREKINVRELWDVIVNMGFETLYKNVFYICCKYLGMDQSIFSEGAELDMPEEQVLGVLFDDIVEGGVFGTTPERSVSFNVVKESYYVGLKKNNKTALFFHLLFPRAIALPKKYLYARRHTVLLPIAWIHRFFSFFYNRITKKDHLRFFDSVQMANDRIKLLERLDLVEYSEKE